MFYRKRFYRKTSFITKTPQGPIKYKLLSCKRELTENKCANFNGIPFGKYKRFERAEPYGKWEGIFDGTGKKLECKYFSRRSGRVPAVCQL